MQSQPLNTEQTTISLDNNAHTSINQQTKINDITTNNDSDSELESSIDT